MMKRSILSLSTTRFVCRNGTTPGFPDAADSFGTLGVSDRTFRAIHTGAHRMILLAILSLLMSSLFASVNAVQDASSTPASTAMSTIEPSAITDALRDRDAPANLPGNTDPEIELEEWEAFYGEALDSTAGAWVMTGSNELPMASILVFETPEGALNGLGEFRNEEATTTAGTLDAWTLADRGKWVCMAVDGPVLIIGQAEPESVDEDQDVVRQRACEVTAEVHVWILDALHTSTTATPDA